MRATIRLADRSELDSIMGLWLESNVSAHDFIPRAYWEAQYERVSRMLPESRVYVYEQEGRLQGFAGLSGEMLEGLFIREGCRSMGIGKALLDRLKEMNQSLSLRVYRENGRAARFYQREGFYVQAVEKDPETGRYEFLMRWSR